MKLKFIAFSFFALGYYYAAAQTCCSGGIPLSSNIGLPNLGDGSLQFGINYDYNNLNTLNVGSDKLDDDSRLRTTHTALFNLGYSFSDRLSFETLFTWVQQRRIISQFEARNVDQTRGIGDGVFLLKYDFPKLIGEGSVWTVGLGSKFPLGDSDKDNTDGIALNADLQPGSGAWDIIYYTALSQSLGFRPSAVVSSRFTYRSTGTNNSYFGETTYKFGNEFQVYLGISDQFLLSKTIISPSLTFKYRKAIRDQIGGFDLDNTGGNWIFIIPSMAINLTSEIIFSTKLELPLYSNVDGTQLTPTYRLTGGIQFNLTPKSRFINLK